MSNKINDYLKELADLNTLEDENALIHFYDISDLIKRAISKTIFKKWNIYAGEIKINENKTIKENAEEHIKNLLDKFGTLEAYRLYRDYEGLKYYLGFHEAQRTGNKIKGVLMYSATNGAYGFVTSLYNFCHLVLKDEWLLDYSFIHSLIDEKGIKKPLYELSGEANLNLFCIKWYKNRKVEITFNSEKEAEKFLETINEIRGLK